MKRIRFRKLLSKNGLFSQFHTHYSTISAESDLIWINEENVDEICGNLIKKLKSLKQDVVNQAQNRSSSTEVLKSLDRMSYEVCNVLDVSTLISYLDSSLTRKKAVLRAQEILEPLIIDFNLDKDILDSLTSVTKHNDNMSFVDRRVYDSYYKEFLKDGVFLDGKQKEDVASLQLRISKYREEHRNDSSIELARKLLKDRQVLAELVGFKDYNEIAFQTLMLNDAAEARDFLNEMMPACKPTLTNEFRDMKQLVQVVNLETLLEYFIFICRELFEVEIIKTELNSQDEWLKELMLFKVVDDKQEGRLYLDLFSRASKPTAPAHFQVQSRTMHSQSAICLVSAGFQKKRWFASKNHISVLESKYLFHELGHAMHSLLSRNKYHQLSATRGELDFVEFPSSFFETFLFDKDLLEAFGKKLMPPSKNEAHILSGLNLYVKQALTDLELHSSSFWNRSEAEIDRDFSSSDLSFLKNYPHLIDYGSSYYVYPYSKVLASNIEYEMFKDRSLQEKKKSAIKLKNEVLRKGGEGCPDEMLMKLIGKNRPTVQVVNSFLNQKA